jgi:hypothetical protein
MNKRYEKPNIMTTKFGVQAVLQASSLNPNPTPPGIGGAKLSSKSYEWDIRDEAEDESDDFDEGNWTEE